MNNRSNPSYSSSPTPPSSDGLPSAFKHAALAVTHLYKEAQHQQQQGYLQALKDLHAFVQAYRNEYPNADALPLDLLLPFMNHKQQQQQQQQQQQSSPSMDTSGLFSGHASSTAPMAGHPAFHGQQQQSQQRISANSGQQQAVFDVQRRKEDLQHNHFLIARALELMDERQYPSTHESLGSMAGQQGTMGTSMLQQQLHPHQQQQNGQEGPNVKRMRLPKRFLD